MTEERQEAKRQTKIGPVAWCQNKIRSMFRFERDMYPKRQADQPVEDQPDKPPKVVH